MKYVLAERGAARRDRGRQAAAKLDLTLRDANPLELALQITDPEWFASYPLDDRTKWELFRDCSRCHTMRRPSMSTYDAEELAWVMMRMVYSAGSSPMRFQLPADATPHWGRTEGGEPSALQKRQAEAVASINLHNGMWSYELKTMPRPKGKETEVVYTTWDLPATARPHDTRIAADGTIWFNHFNDNAIGRLDPKTGEVKEWHWPYRAKEGSFQPTGARTLMGPDEKGRWYIGNQAQSGVVVFDPKTEQFEFHDPPGGGEMIDVSGARVDGNAWRAVAGPVAGGGVYQIDLDDVGSTTRSRARTRSRCTPTTSPPTRATTSTAARAARRTSGASTRRRTPCSTSTFRREPRGVGLVRLRHAARHHGLARSALVGRLRRRLHRHARSRASPTGQQMKLYAVPFPYFFPYDAHYDEQRLHVDGRHLRRSRRAHERRDRRVEFLSAAVRSEHPRHQLAARRRATACRGFGSAIRIKR